MFRFKVPEECQNSCDIRMELPNGDSPQVSDIWFFADIAKHPKEYVWVVLEMSVL